MGSASDDNRFAPPLSHVEDVEPAGPGLLAARSTRLGAALIDVVIASLAFGVLALLTPFNMFKPPAGGSGVWLHLAQNHVIGFVVFLLIQGYLLATQGQTIGKKLLRIRIVRSDGSPASFARIVGLRYLTASLLSAIPVVGPFYDVIDALFIFRRSRRCLHDNIADTIVVAA